MRLRNILIILISIIFLSCKTDKTERIERTNEPDIHKLNDSDKEMDNAILLAQQTINKFKKAYKENNDDYKDFSIKMPFKTTHGYEHIWLSDITYENNEFRGVVNKSPAFTREVNIGDTIMIDTKNISDWMYVENGKLRGGYSIRAIRDKMSASQKKEFDNGFGIIIE